MGGVVGRRGERRVDMKSTSCGWKIVRESGSKICLVLLPVDKRKILLWD